MSVRFALAPAARHRLVRRSLSTIGLGAMLFLGSALAMRLRQNAWLYVLGAAGAVLLIVGVRRLLATARPLVLAEHALWFGTKGVPLSAIESVAVEGEELVVRAGGERRALPLADPAQAAAEIARRAGLRPPQRGGERRWERRSARETE